MRYLICLAMMFAGCGSDCEKGDAGPAGAAGSNAAANVLSFAIPKDTLCHVTGTGYAAKKTGTNSNKVKLYANTACTGAEITTLNSANNDVYASGSLLFILEGLTTSGIVLKRFEF